MSDDDNVLFALLGHPTEPMGEDEENMHTYITGMAFAPRGGGLGASNSGSDKSYFRLRKDEHFSIFRKQHSEMAVELIEDFLEVPTHQEFVQLAKKYRDVLNDSLYQYAMHVAITHRKDSQHIRLPSIVSVFPERFITASDWAKCQRSFRNKLTLEKVVDLSKVYTGTNLDAEHRMAYFREDPGVNLHHYHWHVAYPGRTIKGIPSKDRQGELFYYMHQQILARYNFERFSNSLTRVQQLVNWHEPVEEGYFPRLPATKNGATWMPRQANTKLNAILTDHGVIDIMHMEHWRARIYQAIHSKSALDGNTLHGRIPLDNIEGIDVLGALVEATDKSCNALLYGSLHNTGHDVISNCHDPNGGLSSIPKDEATVLSQIGVMGDVSTACRDPVFYRWHAFVNGIFEEHKNTLDPYEDSDLEFEEVTVESVDIVTEGETETDQFHTFWHRSIIDIEQGIDFAPNTNKEKNVSFSHLNHKEFTYQIKVKLDRTENKMATVRIFLAPMHDDRGLLMNFNDQKVFYVELDRFVQELTPGDNTIQRKSTDSSVTVPFDQQFRPKPSSSSDVDPYCTCGWPQHLLIPKGCAEGLQAQLFVMITDFDNDKVKDSACSKKGLSYCGVVNEQYPDKRPMGFPFDRKIRDRQKKTEQGAQRAFVPNIQEVADDYSNMLVTDVRIIFNPEEKSQ